MKGKIDRFEYKKKKKKPASKSKILGKIQDRWGVNAVMHKEFSKAMETFQLKIEQRTCAENV
jgi:hypothetical protein